MILSNNGRKFIERREQLVLHAYPDIKGIWTIGYGHTSLAGHPLVKSGMVISSVEADAILTSDLKQYERAVNSAIKSTPKQYEYDAMVSLAFNIGPGRFTHSSVVRYYNEGDISLAAEAFLLWAHPSALLERRHFEQHLFLHGDYA